MKTYLDKLKEIYSIYHNGEFIVIPHTKLHILRPDGTLVACRSDLRHAGRITFLSRNRMLLCSNKNLFHMIDLNTGEDLWTAPNTKSNLNSAPIAISSNENYAYTYDNRNGKNFISQLNLDTHEVESIEMYLDAGATQDICCDDDDTPCLLKTRIETIGGKNFLICGVRLHNFYYLEAGFTNNWKTMWYRELPCVESPMIFFGSADRMVTSSLHIFTPATGEVLSLLENETEHTLPQESPASCWMDCNGQYLCLRYMEGNVVIDTQSRKIAATYAAKNRKGCLIGNEYWLGTENGIVRKTFPAFDEIPLCKAPNHFTSLTNSLYSEHPELW